MAEQKIKTYYKPVSDEYVRKPDQILEEQQKRVELNRKLREEQSSLTGKAKRAITGAAGSGVEWMKRRGREIAYDDDTEPLPTKRMTKRELDAFRRKYDYDEPAANIIITPEKHKRGRKKRQAKYSGASRPMPPPPMAGVPRDPFGIGVGRSPFQMGPMSGPFMDRSGPIRKQDSPFSNPFHIPKSMRHLF